MHGIAIEAKGGVTNVNYAAMAGFKQGVWWGWHPPGMAFYPQLAAKIVSASDYKSGTDIRRIAVPTRRKVLVDLNG